MLHRTKKKALFFKLDIAKAFDSVSWEYLLELKQKMGFPPRWRNWIALLLSSATSACLLNGTQGQSISHGCGFRQGDPLSPLLFILAIDPLHHLLQAAAEEEMIARLPGRGISMRVSLYADDAVIFANPVKEEVDALLHLLSRFGEATGLRLNQAKSAVIPINCADVQLDVVLQNFGGLHSTFPTTYLGLPISPRKLRLVHFQFIIDRIRSRLAGWKGKLMNMAGRRVLVRAVLTVLPVFAMTVLKVPKKILKDVDKARRQFLWAHDENVTGAKCKVAWGKVCLPVDKGGLGLLDLHRFSTALRLRWFVALMATATPDLDELPGPMCQGGPGAVCIGHQRALGQRKNSAFLDLQMDRAGGAATRVPRLVSAFQKEKQDSSRRAGK